MFTLNKCLVKNCSNNAVSIIDENGNILDTKNYCLYHTPNPAKIQEDIHTYIKEHDVILGLNANGLSFSNIDISNKKFFGCSFMHCTFSKVHMEDCTIIMTMFNFAFFNDCMLLNSASQFSSFSGCKIMHTLFNDGEIAQNNFNGIQSIQSSFDNSNLCKSRFIHANLMDTSFRNCNLKQADFCKSTFENVSFKGSNTNETIFDEMGSKLFKDLSGKNIFVDFADLERKRSNPEVMSQ